MDRTGQHRDAVPADLVAEVLTGDADGTGERWAKGSQPTMRYGTSKGGSGHRAVLGGSAFYCLARSASMRSVHNGQNPVPEVKMGGSDQSQ